MRRTIGIALGDNARGLGTLRFDAQGSRENAAFAYDTEWLAAAVSFALEPGLPFGDGSAISSQGPPRIGIPRRDHAKQRQEARRAGWGGETGAPGALDILLAVDDTSPRV